MKGQLFTFDSFISLLAFTALLGLISWQFIEVYSTSTENLQDKLDFIARDVAQLAVTNDLIYDNHPNVFDESKLGNFAQKIGLKFADSYAAEINFGSASRQINNGCSASKSVSVANRLMITPNSNDAKWLSVKVCYK